MNCESFEKLKKMYKFISIEIQLDDGKSFYTLAQTQFPLINFLLTDYKRCLRVSFNNGTYTWAGVTKLNDTTLSISCSESAMNKYVVIIRFFN